VSSNNSSAVPAWNLGYVFAFPDLAMNIGNLPNMLVDDWAIHHHDNHTSTSFIVNCLDEAVGVADQSFIVFHFISQRVII
jgi:hypothetical protein